MRQVLLTVGNSMMGDDGAGPLLADLLAQQPAAEWLVIEGGSAPENVTHRVAQEGAARVLLFDAADMGLAPGELRLVDEALIADMFIMSTHNLPLNFVMERLREHGAQVDFLGVQPDLVAFGCPIGAPVQAAVEQVAAVLRSGEDPLQVFLPL